MEVGKDKEEEQDEAIGVRVWLVPEMGYMQYCAISSNMVR